MRSQSKTQGVDKASGRWKLRNMGKNNSVRTPSPGSCLPGHQGVFRQLSRMVNQSSGQKPLTFQSFLECLAIKNCFIFEVVCIRSWLSPSRQFSLTQPLAHYPLCPQWDVGDNQKHKNEKTYEFSFNGLKRKVTAAHTSKAKIRN